MSDTTNKCGSHERTLTRALSESTQKASDLFGLLYVVLYDKQVIKNRQRLLAVSNRYS